MGKVKINDKLLEKIKIEYEKCIDCKLCMEGCPMLEQFCKSPKELLEKLAKQERVDYKLPYSCLLCEYCTAVCPKDVDLREIFFKLRGNIVCSTCGNLPKDLSYTPVKYHQKNSFSKLFSTDVLGLESKSDIIFFPGCSLMAYSPKIVEKTYEYLKDMIQGIGIYLKCCGRPTNSIGFSKDFDKYYDILRKDFNKNDIKRVITACQNCFKTIKENSLDLEVIPLWDVISEKGVPDNVKGKGKNIDLTFYVHDPCPTRYETSTHDSIRNILAQIGLQYEEMGFSRKKTLCCGSGGMVALTNNSIALNQMKKRANQAKGEYVATYCEECVQSMKRGGKKSFHILDLLFNEDIYKTFNQKEVGFLKKWFNRFKGKIQLSGRYM